MTGGEGVLQPHVEKFACDLRETLQGVLTTTVDLDISQLAPSTAEQQERFVVALPSDGLSLTRQGRPFLRMRARFHCGWDGRRAFTKVDRADIVLLPEGETHPVVRFEQISRAHGDRLPCAHLHVHTDDPRVVSLLAEPGGTTHRSRKHRSKARQGKAQMSDLHLPVGGRRFRPALEDILHMAVEEFGVDAEPRWQERLADGREHWRRLQVRTVARDAPEEAAASLRALGYRVTPPQGGPPEDYFDPLREL